MIDRTVLIVDDNTAMCDNMEDIIRECGFTAFSANSCAEGLHLAEERQPIIALLDLKLPDGLGTNLLTDLKRIVPRCVCIIMTAFADVDSAISALEKGAFHYLHKPVKPAELLQILERAYEMIRLQEENKLAEKALCLSEEKYRTLVENLNVGVYRCSSINASFIQANPAMGRLFGCDASDVMSFSFFDFMQNQEEGKSLYAEVLQTGGIRNREIACVKKNGDLFWVSCTANAQYDDSGLIKWIDGVVEEITDRKKFEAQQRFSQKMEAVGTLAGGVAHDFNNILTAIAGNATLLKMKLTEDDPLLKYADNILMSSEKAAAITRRLLTFSRKQLIELYPVNLNEVVMRLAPLLEDLVGENVNVHINFLATELKVLADSEQIEQVLVNIAANARVAMPNGGDLTIQAGRLELSEEYLRGHGYGVPGSYALIAITDTGIGMDKQTMVRVFEPFFTLEGVGKGTGLGLSIAYGIVKQHNGYINVYSEPGEGTTFKIYIPLHESKPDASISNAATPQQGGAETLLLAEDDAEVRAFEQDFLQQFGYTVIEAVDGADAVSKFQSNKEDIRLVILDVIMPNKNGKEAYDEIRTIRPDIKVLFTSGYTNDILSRKGILEDGVMFCSKPVAPEELLKKVREVLDR